MGRGYGRVRGLGLSFDSEANDSRANSKSTFCLLRVDKLVLQLNRSAGFAETRDCPTNLANAEKCRIRKHWLGSRL